MCWLEYEHLLERVGGLRELAALQRNHAALHLVVELDLLIGIARRSGCGVWLRHTERQFSLGLREQAFPAVRAGERDVEVGSRWLELRATTERLDGVGDAADRQ